MHLDIKTIIIGITLMSVFGGAGTGMFMSGMTMEDLLAMDFNKALGMVDKFKGDVLELVKQIQEQSN